MSRYRSRFFPYFLQDLLINHLKLFLIFCFADHLSSEWSCEAGRFEGRPGPNDFDLVLPPEGAGAAVSTARSRSCTRVRPGEYDHYVPRPLRPLRRHLGRRTRGDGGSYFVLSDAGVPSCNSDFWSRHLHYDSRSGAARNHQLRRCSVPATVCRRWPALDNWRSHGLITRSNAHSQEPRLLAWARETHWPCNRGGQD